MVGPPGAPLPTPKARDVVDEQLSHPAGDGPGRSARGPAEVAAAEQVQVQGRHGLPGPLLAVEDQAGAVGDAELLAHLGGVQVQWSGSRAVLPPDVVLAG